VKTGAGMTLGIFMDNFLKFSIRNNLLAINFLLIFFLVWFFNIGILPFKVSGDFIFFVILIFAFALYRPGWAFLFFIGTIALENITLIPKEIGLMLRPYQLLGFLILLAIVIRFFVKRLNFSLPKLKWYDVAVILIGLSSFLSIVVAPDRLLSFKLAVVIFSFIFLYFLTRIFIQDVEDVSRIAPFFLGSSLVVIFYGIWQNILFARGLNSFEVMPGRPNSTFAEADWLGIYLLLIIAVLYSLMFYFDKKREKLDLDAQISNFQIPISNQIQNPKSKKYFILSILYVLLLLSNILLIITVSRSAWLGAGIATIFFLLATLFSGWKIFWRQAILVISIGIISIAVVYAFNLTNFQLFNRMQSTGTGLQKITIACQEDSSLPKEIKNISQLEKYSCRHINLEDIDREKSAGNIIKEIDRTDPNMNIRSVIYKKSWEQIKAHPILGIGWGNIGGVLGKDERGAGLNSSNIFLEIWLGSGILGLVAFLSVWLYIFLKSIYEFFKTKDILLKTFSLFIAISWLGLTVANFFNAGIMLGFLWVWMAVSVSLNSNNLKQ
jgi:hypothetical protein